MKKHDKKMQLLSRFLPVTIQLILFALCLAFVNPNTALDFWNKDERVSSAAIQSFPFHKNTVEGRKSIKIGREKREKIKKILLEN